jgi:hypothetical protein
MARPKKKKGEVKRLVVQASIDWADLVERGAKHCRTDVSKLIDVALADYLRARGFTDPPPDRTP